MAVNDFYITPYLEEARERKTLAFDGLPVFDKFLQLMLSEQLNVQDAIRQLMQDRSIDTAVGKQLDIIGDIVGQPRQLTDVVALDWFGFDGAQGANSYGSTLDTTTGGYYYDVNESLLGTLTLTDEQYRVFIKAKIMKNTTSSTPEDVIAFLKYVLGVSEVLIASDSIDETLIFVSDDLDQFRFNILQRITLEPYRSYFFPKTLGVGFQFATMPLEGFFGFYATPNAKGYGSLGETGGGIYASLT